MNFFEKYLSIWVALCIVIGVSIGIYIPSIPETLAIYEYAKVSIPVAILIWLMIYPMMLKIDYLVTMGCETECPFVPAREIINFNMDAYPSNTFEEKEIVVNILEEKVKQFFESIS